MDYFTFDGKELLRFETKNEAEEYVRRCGSDVVVIAGSQDSGAHLEVSRNMPRLIEVDIEKVEGQTIKVDVKVDGVPLEETIEEEGS